EAGLQAYTGKFLIPAEQITKDVSIKNTEVLDQRAAASLVVYPQPFGFQAEYNIGVGPEYNPQTNSIDSKNLQGGYAMMMYRIKFGKQQLFPFVRSQFYEGGKKHETDARKYRVREHEFGLEWQPFTNFEIVAMYTISERTFEDSKLRDNKQAGNLLRLQLQFNY
ncbi:MAG: porin, partial [Bacteroidia bacterium]